MERGGGDSSALPSLNDASIGLPTGFLESPPRPNMKLPPQYLTFRCSTHLALLVRPLLLVYYKFFFLFSLSQICRCFLHPGAVGVAGATLSAATARGEFGEPDLALSLFLCVRPPPSLFPPPPFRVKSIFPSFPPFIGSPDPSRRRGR